MFVVSIKKIIVIKRKDFNSIEQLIIYFDCSQAPSFIPRNACWIFFFIRKAI